MDTINISLPSQLKNQADASIKRGEFASFSDLVRTALRRILDEAYYNSLVREAIRDHKAGNSIVLKSKKDIHTYLLSKMK